MDINKINNDLLGRLYKNKPIYYSYLDLISPEKLTQYIMLSDSYYVAILEKDDVYINYQKGVEVKEMYEKFIPDDSNYLYTHVTDTVMLSGKDKLRVLENENTKILVNEKYLSLFDKCTFKSLTDTKPIICYKEGQVAGIILPVKQY